jgi:hypothetical protein
MLSPFRSQAGIELNFTAAKANNFLFRILLDSKQAYHVSGFGVCCLGSRQDLKPDYRISGFGSNDLMKAVF